MPTVWIVHREDRARAALARLAAAADAIAGRPSDGSFDSAAAADVVVLGLSGDWEEELEFAHRHRARQARARWLLIGDKDRADAARALFDQLSFEYLPYPPRADALRRAVRPPAPARPPLSQRSQREAVAARFSRWLADLDLPELMRALDPRLVDVPLLIRGEPGTGRAALVRYVHHFGGTADGAFAHLACGHDTEVTDIGNALAAVGRARPRLTSLTAWLDEPGRLATHVQRELAAWLDAGIPPGVNAPVLRWLTTVDSNDLPIEEALARAVGTIEIRLPALRERPGRIESLVAATTRAWAEAHREAPRHFDADAHAFLQEYPWPGNLRELEAVVEQTLASTARDPVRADDLVLEGEALAPVEASELGTLLPDDEIAEPVVIAQPEPPGTAAEEPPDTEPIEEAAAVQSAAIGAGPWVPAPIVHGPPDLPAAGPPRPSGRALDGDPGLRRLAQSLIHQVRNPLSTIRTFADLLPERFEDPDFRARFPEMVREDVGRIHGLLERLERLAALDAPARDKVDVTALLETLLEERRDAFRSRHLLVLKELDATHPTALADPAQLRLAFEALLDKALAVVPDRGDLYIASRHHQGGPSEPAWVRVLLRFHDPSVVRREAAENLEQSFEILIAELVVRAQDGRLTFGASEAEERVLVVDLPSP